ncbi:Rieske (2Fe-2S) protein [Acidobacteria bacterium AH-259-G07]|nr:Rieske (2Fe-2S) protein [Acidobacteria bacterium AH-259-G07]
MERRGFFRKLACGLIGAGLILVPFGAGVIFFLDALRRGSRERGFVRVAWVDSLPVGIPRSFTITGTRTDAWNTDANVPIGAVYLLRHEQEVEAFQVICPHAGCFVEYDPNSRQFLCPCHDSSFNLDGSIANPGSPSARGLDKLEVKVQGTDVLVRYQEFQQGIREKIAVS